MKKKIVVKVNINCKLCKIGVLKAVTKLQGIDGISIDGDKGTLTVLGEVDPVDIVKQLRKIGRVAHIESVGPPEEPKPASRQKPIPVDLVQPVWVPLMPHCCNSCQLVDVYVESSSCCIV